MNYSTREKQILQHAFEYRVLPISNMRNLFFPGLAMKTVYKYLDWITNKHPEILEKKKVDGAKEIALVAKPSPGLASTYPDHDYVISRIRLALEGSLNDDTWISEAAFRVRAYDSGPKSSGKDAIPRIPDALWCIRQERLKFIAIEFERSPKSIARINEIIRNYENKRNKIDHVLFFTATKQIAKSYQNILNEFISSLGQAFVPKSRIIDLSSTELDLNSTVWPQNIRELVFENINIQKINIGEAV